MKSFPRGEKKVAMQCLVEVGFSYRFALTLVSHSSFLRSCLHALLTTITLGYIFIWSAAFLINNPFFFLTLGGRSGFN